MTDRLKDIWLGFARSTRAQLTTTELSPLARPSGTERAERDLAAGLTGQKEGRQGPAAGDAVQAAMEALRSDLEGKAKRARKGRRVKQGAAPEGAASGQLSPAVEAQLFSDLAFTEARVRRSSSDYLTFAQARQDAWSRKRKRFLGLF